MIPEKSDMLAFNVSQLLKEGVGAFRQRTLDGELAPVDALNAEHIPVTGAVTMVRTPAGVLVTGEAALTLQVACRRCLEPVTRELTLEIEEEFVPSIDVVSGRPVPVDPEVEPELVIDVHHTLDLTEVLWQLAVAESMRPTYCREGCKGLCPHCGANLNDGPCGCVTDRADPRLAVLAQLLGAADHPDLNAQGEEE
ncbi:MAG: YceD family protein [Anaerolineae bacterium]